VQKRDQQGLVTLAQPCVGVTAGVNARPVPNLTKPKIALTQVESAVYSCFAASGATPEEKRGKLLQHFGEQVSSITPETSFLCVVKAFHRL
jgi:hypothetical protein